MNTRAFEKAIIWFLTYCNKLNRISLYRPKTDKPALGDDMAIYTVRGIALGHTTVQFIATQKFGRQVTSESKEIQVFPPLRLEPRNITIIIGAIFEVSVLAERWT